MSSKRLDRTDGESKDGRTGKKCGIDIDYDKLFSSNDSKTGVEDPPPDILVVKSSACDDRSERDVERQQGEKGEREPEHPPCLNLPVEIQRLEDRELNQKIHTLSGRLKGLSSNLPDKGEKLKNYLKQHVEEKGRRERCRPSENATGCNKPALSGSSGRSGSPHASKQDPVLGSQSSSGFAVSFRQKLDGNKDSRICDSFGPELDSVGRRGRNKARRIGPVAPKREEKCHLPLMGKKESALSSEQIYSDRRNLADTNSRRQSSPRDIRRSLRQKIQKSKKTVCLSDDEEEPESILHNEDDAALRGMSIFYPTGEDPESVEIRYEDLQCLARGVYLTSTIMNFYIRYLQVSSSLDNNNHKYFHFFNTYFYKKLQEAVAPENPDCEALFIKLRRWWKGIDIFQKAYLFLPIHENLHWSLVIICIPDKEDESGPVILHLDSLGYHNSRSIFQFVKRLLKEEWKYLKGEADPPNVPLADRIWEQLPSKIEVKVVTVPQQNNDSDCGPFVLFFLERFISEAPPRLQKQNLSMFGKQWFKPEEASSLRVKLKKLLMEEFDKAKTRVAPPAAEQLSDDSSSEIL